MDALPRQLASGALILVTLLALGQCYIPDPGNELGEVFSAGGPLKLWVREVLEKFPSIVMQCKSSGMVDHFPDRARSRKARNSTKTHYVVKLKLDYIFWAQAPVRKYKFIHLAFTHRPPDKEYSELAYDFSVNQDSPIEEIKANRSISCLELYYNTDNQGVMPNYPFYNPPVARSIVTEYTRGLGPEQDISEYWNVRVYVNWVYDQVKAFSKKASGKSCRPSTNWVLSFRRKDLRARPEDINEQILLVKMFITYVFPKKPHKKAGQYAHVLLHHRGTKSDLLAFYHVPSEETKLEYGNEARILECDDM